MSKKRLGAGSLPEPSLCIPILHFGPDRFLPSNLGIAKQISRLRLTRMCRNLASSEQRTIVLR